MTMWIRRNGRALLIIVLMIDLIGITVTRPAWQEHIGFLRPKRTVPYGRAIDLGGVRWQLISLKPPSKAALQSDPLLPGDSASFPPDTRLVTYLLQRDRHGKPGGLPAGYSGCQPIFWAGKRQWQALTMPLSVQFWGERMGYSTICGAGHDGPLLVARFVPIDAHISSIDVQFLPNSWNDTKKLSSATDLLVVRFETG
jgi:hypothetical protein